MLTQNEDAFRHLSEAALKSLREGKEHDLLSLGMRRPTGDGEEAITGRHFLTYRQRLRAPPMARIGSNASRGQS
jgi:hypothetical protein